MTLRSTSVGLALAGFLIVSPGLVAQQGKKGGGKPPDPPPLTGVATIRCLDAGVSGPGDPQDAICSDGLGTYTDGVDDAAVRIRQSDGTFGLSLPEGGARNHVIRIPGFPADWDHVDCDQADPNRCVSQIAAGGETFQSAALVHEGASRPYIDARTLESGGMLSLAEGVSYPSTLLIGWNDPRDASSSVRWSLYWNADYYAGSHDATVVRNGCTWTITAGPDDLAGFWLFRTGKGRFSDEQQGRFRAPVQITFTATDNCPY